jgi:hypothetical protein
MSQISHSFLSSALAESSQAIENAPIGSAAYGTNTTMTFKWIDAIESDVVKLPLLMLKVSEDGTCTVNYSIDTFRRYIMTRIDLRFFSESGFMLLDGLSLSPQQYDGPGNWRDQTKSRNWREVRYDFARIRRASFSLYVEHRD